MLKTSLPEILIVVFFTTVRPMFFTIVRLASVDVSEIVKANRAVVGAEVRESNQQLLVLVDAGWVVRHND